MYYQQPPPASSPVGHDNRSLSAPSAPPADDSDPPSLYPLLSPTMPGGGGSFLYPRTNQQQQHMPYAASPGGITGPPVSIPMHPPQSTPPMNQQMPLSPVYSQSFSYQQQQRGSFTGSMPPPSPVTTNQSFHQQQPQQQRASFNGGLAPPNPNLISGRTASGNGSLLQGGYGPVDPTLSIPVTPLQNHPAAIPSSVVELRFRCKGLKKSDFLSESDPFLVVYLQEDARSWREIGRTETVVNTADPTFTKAFHIDFFFEEVQRLRIEVFDRDSPSNKLSDHDFLGCVELTMGQLMSSKGQSMLLSLLQKEKGRHVYGISGHVVISAEEVSTCSDMINVQFAGEKLDNKDGWFGASDPFLNIYRIKDENADPASPSSWVHVWKSETIMDNLNPRWRMATLSVQLLCNGNLSRMLKFECMDWENSGRHQLIGVCTMTAAELVSGEKQRVDLINRERQLKKGKRYKNSGVLKLLHVECFKQHTFAEFLRGGCEISLIVGIDYTASNGAASDPQSLHYIGGSYTGQGNDYQAAISATGAILEPYDADRKFPTYGFGGMVNGYVNHCFPLTFDPTQPEVEGVRGILQAYANSFQMVQLHGPTYFAPLIRQAATIATHFSNPAAQPSMSDMNLKYFVLLIITDGAIMDMQATIDEIVQASFLPMSIVIVGVGNADFSAMDTLDGDGKLLMDSRRRVAARDIVQFVPFNQFRNNPARLAKETLAEIPMQLVQHFKARGIKPHAPLERMGTDTLINSAMQGMNGNHVSVNQDRASFAGSQV
uniref:C2 domain-containing protein n=1 Tax=Globisporangium ultimum (strain ATCC 200006 / CBS 805.95 / DAOM BR144) TaxID=431595 RepID=K3X660_GLOUD